MIELDHDKRTHLKDELYINILAADDCNPELCHKYFGCSMIEKNFGSTSIDSIAVFYNGDEFQFKNTILFSIVHCTLLGQEGQIVFFVFPRIRFGSLHQNR